MSSVVIRSYIMTADTGFAPNPFWGYCTLATCKPDIRRAAKIGEYIVGVSGRTLEERCGIAPLKLIYVMRVDEVLTFDEYSKDRRFERKVPSYGKINERGDNIYFLEDGKWYIRPSYHYEDRPETWRKDLCGKRVLVSYKRSFYYFGSEAEKIPDEFHGILKKSGPSHRRSEGDLARRFIQWIKREFEPGIIGEPCIFEQEKSEDFFKQPPKLVMPCEKNGK